MKIEQNIIIIISAITVLIILLICLLIKSHEKLELKSVGCALSDQLYCNTASSDDKFCCECKPDTHDTGSFSGDIRVPVKCHKTACASGKCKK